MQLLGTPRARHEVVVESCELGCAIVLQRTQGYIKVLVVSAATVRSRLRCTDVSDRTWVFAPRSARQLLQSALVARHLFWVQSASIIASKSVRILVFVQRVHLTGVHLTDVHFQRYALLAQISVAKFSSMSPTTWMCSFVSTASKVFG